MSLGKKLSVYLRRVHPLTLTAWIIMFLFSLAGSIVSVVQYWQYQVFYYDFGIFDEAIWKVAHFQPPIIDHMVIGGKWIFADHFSPSIFLLSPFYWFTSRSEIILIAQAAIVGLSGIVLYLIGWEILKNRLASFAIMLSYFLFVGTQNAVITDFHEITIAALPFMLTFYAALKKNKWLYFISLLILLGCKESNFLIGIGIAIAVFFLNKSWRKISFLTFILSLAWGLMAIKFIIPAFSGGLYQYNQTIPLNPITIVTSLFDNPTKRHTIFYSFSSFGFLPIFSPAFWFLIFQDLLVRMLPDWETRWGLGLHYSILLSAIMGVSSVFGFKLIFAFIKKNIYRTALSLLLLFNALFLYRFILHGPFALSYNTAFYAHTKDFAFINTMIKKIPAHAYVGAQNNIISHFTHQKTWMLRSRVEADIVNKAAPDYILLDARDGQNPNNYFGIIDMHLALDSLLNNTNYTITYHSGNQYIFKRITTPGK